MPNYDYACADCGPFTAMRPMAQYRDLSPCPTCAAPAQRAIGGAPAIFGLGPTPPRSVAASGGARPSAQASHPAGCGCCVRRWPTPLASAGGGRVFTSSGPPARSVR